MTASVLSSLTSPSLLLFWEIVEAASIVVIGVGCWGEGWAEHHRFADAPASLIPTGAFTQHRFKRLFWRMVLFGLGVELFAFGFSLIASYREIEGLRANNLKLEARLADDEASRSARFLSRQAEFIASLKDKPVAEVEFMYVPGDQEGFGYSFTIGGCMEQAGWKMVRIPEPIPEDKVCEWMKSIPVDELKQMPPVMRATGSDAEITVRSRPGLAAGTALVDALRVVELKGSFSEGVDNSLPTNRILLVIGPKP